MQTRSFKFVYVLLVFSLSGCVSVVHFNQSSKSNENNSIQNYTEEGLASYYSDAFEGKETASGEIFTQTGLTAAHRWLPFGTIVKVTNLENGKSILVKINDRGPFVPNRIIDLSKMASQKLGFYNKGIAKVRIEVVE
jgi:rare lipoprotein A